MGLFSAYIATRFRNLCRELPHIGSLAENECLTSKVSLIILWFDKLMCPTCNNILRKMHLGCVTLLYHSIYAFIHQSSPPFMPRQAYSLPACHANIVALSLEVSKKVSALTLSMKQANWLLSFFICSRSWARICWISGSTPTQRGCRRSSLTLTL